MPCVTLLVTGVPRYVLLENLSCNLDFLFDTDEIGTFKLRNLPNHPRTNKRQVALDFRSGFDAMAAQAKLDNFEYEYNGEMFTLNAKVNKVEEYMRSDPFSPETELEDRDGWRSALRTMPEVYDENMYRATHTKLNAHLALLRKQKLIVEAERELLREKRKLKREYGSIDGHDSEYEATPSKHRRHRSRGRRSGSRRRRSKSREGHVVRGSMERRTRSRDRSRPRLAWDDRTRQLRSRSKERRSQSHETDSRDRSMSRELSDLRSLILSKKDRRKSRERSKSGERVQPMTERPYSDPRSMPQERHFRGKWSQSYERDYRDPRLGSRERDRERTSVSRERDDGYYIFSRERVRRDRRSTSRYSPSRYTERRSKEHAFRRSRSRNRRLKSRDRTHDDELIVQSRPRGYRVQSTKTLDSSPLAIMPNPKRSEAPREWSLDAHEDANEPPMISVTMFRNGDGTKNINISPTVKNKQIANVPKKNSKDSDGINETEENGKVGSTKCQKENQEKYNRKIRKAQLLELKIDSVAQNVKLLVLETLYELILEGNVIISDSNKILLEKTLEELVRERVEPLVRVRKDCDIGVVLRKYKLQYSKENDVLLIKKMLEDISKTNESHAVSSTSIINEPDNTSSDIACPSTEIQDCSMAQNFTDLNKDNELQENACSGSNPITTEGKESSENPKECDANIPNEHAENNDVNSGNFWLDSFTLWCETIENAPQIKGEISETNGPTIIIDIDSPDKPVPKHPKFYLVIKGLVKEMKRVIANNNLTQLIKISDLEYVLRHILRDLVKGQRYLPNKEIKSKFRALHPKEKDGQFIKNVIKDIKDGKYPVLTGLPTTDDCEDDVILIEKKYDVVTVDDSDDDDDDVTITGEQKATPQIPIHCPVDSSSEVTGTANLGTTNIGPEKDELAKDKPTKLGPSKLGTAKQNLGPSELNPCNPIQVNSIQSNLGATEVPINPTVSRWNLVNPCSVNLDPNEPVHNPTPGSIQPGSTVFIPAHGTSKLVTTDSESSKIRVVNPGSANACSTVVRAAPDTSKLVTANPNNYKLRVVNRGSANLCSTGVRPAPDTSKLVSSDSESSKLRIVNSGSANACSTVARPASHTSKLVTTNSESSRVRVVNPGSANRCSTVIRPAPDTSKLVTSDSDSSKLRVVNHDSANFCSTVVRPTPDTSKLVTTNPNNPKLRVVNPVSANLCSTVVRPAPGSSKLVKANSENNVTVTEMRPTNLGPSRSDLIKPRSANFTPFKLRSHLGKINTGLFNRAQAVPSTSNVKQVISGPSKDTQVKLNPFNIAQVNPDPSNHDATELRPTNPRTSRWDLVNPSSTNLSATAFRPKPGSSHALQVIPGLYDLERVNLGPLNVARVNPEPTNRSTNFGPDSPGTCKFLPACLRPAELRPALATSKIRPVTPGPATDAVKTTSQTTEKATIDDTGIMAHTDKCKANENETKTVIDDTKNANDSENIKEKTAEIDNLKVTAITIVTSVNELAAITDKTTDGPTMEVPIEDIKEEIPFENSDTALSDTPLKLASNQSSLVTSITDKANSENGKHNGNKAIEATEDNSSNSLKVTAITIATSLNELTKISDKTTDSSKMEVPIKDIKEEIPFENSEEPDPTLSLDHITSLTKTDNTKNYEGYRNKATERVEEGNISSLKVTAITIMTSLTELAAIADQTTDGSRIPIEDIKEEIETEISETEQIDSTSKPDASHEYKKVINEVTSYDKEKAMPKNTQGTSDQVDSSFGQGIGRIGQENNNYPDLITSEKGKKSQDNTASDEEDETIESIVKYVQSLL